MSVGSILEAARAAGGLGLRATVVCEDLAAYQRVYDEQLATLPGVQRLTSTLVMKDVVPERAAKIGAAPRGRWQGSSLA